MKIAAIEYFPTSTKGGSEKAYYEVLTSLNNLGHHVTVFYVVKGDLLFKYRELGITHIQLPQVDIKYLNLRSWFNLIKSAFIINKAQSDIIYINQHADSVLASLCKLLRKTSIICHIRVPKIGNSRLFNLVGKYINYYICVNHKIKTQYSNYYNLNKLMVVNDGIKMPALETLPQIKPAKTNYATYLGRISPEKGLIQLLSTWQILIDKYNLKIHLDITGPADSEIEKKHKLDLLEIVKQKNLTSLIKIKDAISNSHNYFKNYDFSVFPSIIDESFGRTIPESVLSGTPVFARKVGIVKEILAPLKDIFVYDKEEELAEKIYQFYNFKNDIDLKVLQKHIHKHYDIDKNIYLIEDIFKKSLEQ